MNQKEARKIYDHLTNLISYEDIANHLRLAALGGRICYSSDSVESIIENDDRVNGDNVIEYLKRLTDKNHTSILSHNVIIKDLSNIDIRYSLDEMLGNNNDLAYLFEYFDAYQEFPIYQDEQHKDKVRKAYITILKMLLRYYSKGIPYTPNSYDLTINFRTLLELAKLLGEDDKIWNNLNNVSLPKIKIIETITTSTNSKVYILRYDRVSEKGEVITFILENVSRVLTHQLVRHKLDVEYSQRSHRYTKIKMNSDDINEIFVIPKLDYINNETKRIEYQNLFELEYVNEIQVYESMITKKDNIQVRAEDARYIIGDGIRTTIMTTFYSKETIDNFLKLRNDNHSQWEIREIAEIIDNFRSKFANK